MRPVPEDALLPQATACDETFVYREPSGHDSDEGGDNATESASWSCGMMRIDGDRATRFPVYAFVPANAWAVVVFFHGTGGGAANILGRVEFRRFFAMAQQTSSAKSRGPMAFVVTESTDRTDKQWDPRGTVDIERVAYVLTTLKAQRVLPDDTPIFSIGVSNGSVFSQVVSHRLRFAANLAHVGGNATDRLEFEQTPTDKLVPQFYVLNANDHVINNDCAATPTSTPQRTLECQYPFEHIYPALRARMGEQCTRLAVLEPAALTPEALRRIPEVQDLEARELIQCLQSRGLLGPDGRLDFDPILEVSTYRSPVLRCLDEAGISRNLAKHITDQLELAYAEHGYTARFACEQLEFLTQCGADLY